MELYQLLKNLEDNPDLVDILVEIEDYLDSLSIYAFKGWADCEIVEGPNIRKYFVDITLKTSYKKMPDPKFGLRLLKNASGSKVVYMHAKQQVPVSTSTATLDRDARGQPRMKLEKIWLIKLSIPRRFIHSLTVDNVDLYGDNVNQEHLQGAKQSGITGESPFQAETEEAPF